jgi:hypothetical protein
MKMTESQMTDTQTPEVKERLEVLRRIAERGLALAVKEQHSSFTDLFQHMLNEKALLERALTNSAPSKIVRDYVIAEHSKLHGANRVGTVEGCGICYEISGWLNAGPVARGDTGNELKAGTQEARISPSTVGSTAGENPVTRSNSPAEPAAPSGVERDCTCSLDDDPPRPCPRKFAYHECMRAALSREKAAREAAEQKAQEIIATHQSIMRNHDEMFAQYIDSNNALHRELAAANRRAEEMERALGQASFCLRELLPNDKDAQLTVQMIEKTRSATEGKDASPGARE